MSTLLPHVLIAGLAGSLLALTPPGHQGQLTWGFWLKQAGVFALLAAAYAVNASWGLPQLLYRGRVATYVLLNVAWVLGILLVHEQLDNRLWAPVLGPPTTATSLPPGPPPGPAPGRLGPPPRRPPGNSGPGLFNPSILLISGLVLGLGTTLGAVQRSQRDALFRQDLEQARLATELTLLKAQINPHFFFNTLNNIYSLTLIDGDQARAALHRLSRMMRYVLYDTPADTALLSQELTFLRDYVELMHLRLTDSVTVTLDLPTPHPDAPIAPMLLLPFVENAFKHGVSAHAPSRITVALHQPTPHTLALSVRNTLFPKRTTLEEAGGIGLANTLRRLELLYPSRHTLHVDAAAQEYHVHLTLVLAGSDHSG